MVRGPGPSEAALCPSLISPTLRVSPWSRLAPTWGWMSFEGCVGPATGRPARAARPSAHRPLAVPCHGRLAARLGRSRLTRLPASAAVQHPRPQAGLAWTALSLSVPSLYLPALFFCSRAGAGVRGGAAPSSAYTVLLAIRHWSRGTPQSAHPSSAAFILTGFGVGSTLGRSPERGWLV